MRISLSNCFDSINDRSLLLLICCADFWKPFRHFLLKAMSCSKYYKWSNLRKSNQEIVLRFKRLEATTTYLCASHNVFRMFFKLPAAREWNNKFAWLICGVKSLICKIFFFGWEKGIRRALKITRTSDEAKSFWRNPWNVHNIWWLSTKMWEEEKIYVVSACAVHHPRL